MKKQDFHKILNLVPPDYYQNGVRKNPLQRYWHGTKINFALKLLNNLVFKNCLDVGSASGYMISRVAKRYPDVRFYAIDAYAEAIEFAKKQYPHISFIKAEAEKLPFKNNQFDLILYYETIEHVRDPKKSMLEIKRVLKKSGKLILAMDSGSFIFRVVWFFWEKTYGRIWQKAHLNPYHHSDLEDLVMKSGFKVIKKYFTHFGMEVVFIIEQQ